MMRKLLCLALALCLCLILSAGACAEEAAAVTAAELEALGESLRAEALRGALLNDPADEDAQGEDGSLFQYVNFALFADGSEMTEDTKIRVILFRDSEGDVFRESGIDTQVLDLLPLFPRDNTNLAGTAEEAVLYLRDTENGGYVYGLVFRDGQRITALTLGEVAAAEGGFRRADITYTLEQGRVSAIRVEGAFPDTAETLDAEAAEEMYREMKELAGTDEYRAVPMSRDGTLLTPFGAEDLEFSGFSYLSLKPDSLPGAPDRELIDNEDGTWLMRCDGDGYEAVFRCGADGQDAEILSFTILDGGIEGPRYVRVGDLFNEDYCRFRSEGEAGDDMKETLYGTREENAWGEADYAAGAGEMSLRYVTEAEGKSVELLLKYEMNVLTEIIIRTL